MKITNFSLFLLATMIAGFSYSQGVMEGFVLDRTTKKPLENTKLKLFVYRSSKPDSTKEEKYVEAVGKTVMSYHYFFDTSWQLIQTTFSDCNGHYRFDSIDKGYYAITSFFTTGRQYGRNIGESERISSIQVNNNTQSINFFLPVFCKYDLTKNLSTCPNCKKEKGVRIQRYGLPVHIKGEKFVEEDGRYFYNGNCSPDRCRPDKICVLCKTEF